MGLSGSQQGAYLFSEKSAAGERSRMASFIARLSHEIQRLCRHPVNPPGDALVLKSGGSNYPPGRRQIHGSGVRGNRRARLLSIPARLLALASPNLACATIRADTQR